MKRQASFHMGPSDANGTGEVEKLQSIFIQNVSHEFRTPLGIIQGYAEMMHDGELGELEPEQVRALSIVVGRARELRTMVERLGIIMAVEMHSAFLIRLDMTEITMQVLEENRVDADRAGIELVASTEPDLPSVLGDWCQLKQVVEGLVENALKFTPGGGRIEVKVYAEPEWVCLAVTDTGVGIPKWELDRVFSGFYQADGSSTRRYSGIGLGLTLVKAVTEEHGGRVEVNSQPGRGSQFLVRLPILQSGDQMEQPSEDVVIKPQHVPILNSQWGAVLSLQETRQYLVDCEVLDDNGKFHSS
ncbi:MAG: HAMP domain-containing histidine kinase [Chloroflexi bacterium]|nr:HAMP domain-containing histidine kinase [Chloroflexota bacterium]